jgi:hypothetical protein
VKRCLSNVLAGVLMVLCAASSALWVRSNWWTDRLIWQHAGSVRSVASVQGDIVMDMNVENSLGLANYMGFEQYPHDDLRPIQLRSCSFPSAPYIFDFRHLGGFWWCAVRTPAGIQGIEIVVPHWSLAPAILALPLGRALLRMKRRMIARWRQNSILCPTCGYDLRATPERCPECGRIPSARAVQFAT